jgi:SAM-dependent methyltransferase
MPTVETAVQAHYGQSNHLERIEQRLKAMGVDPLRPTIQDLNLFDQLHGYGIVATEAHADRAGIRAGMHVLDLGCGLGGSSRYLAAVRACRVTAIDLTPEFISVARVLTERCRLPVSIDYREANALALPFDDESFDHVWCHNVTMNVADKAGLATEVCRVLRTDGRFSCVETEQGPGGPPEFPVPWASDPAYSFLVTPETMRAALVGAGLHVIEQIRFQPDLAKRGSPPRQAQDIVMGDDFEIRLENIRTGTREDRLVDQFILAEKLRS